MGKQQSNMIICITGGSGFIGTQMTKHFIAQGHRVVVFDIMSPKVSHQNVSFFKINLMNDEIPDVLKTCDAVVHLSGVSIFNRWTVSYKKEIYDSRIISTRKLVDFFTKHKQVTQKPLVFVCASAVGFYGDGGEEILDESKKPGDDFLAEVCADWEHEAQKAVALGVRVVSIRTGIVLGVGGGMLAKLVPIFRLGLGGRFGTGKQWFSWIHMNDLIKVYESAVFDERLSGAVNAVAQESVRNSDLVQLLAHAVHRPAYFILPKWLLKIILGEFACAVLMSQRVTPQKLSSIDFHYAHPTLQSALVDIV